jgi:DNA-binding protein H-NS
VARTFIDIQKEIEKLQAEAETLKTKELGEVIERIREAIKHYGLTKKDLFGPSAPKKAVRKARKVARKRTAKSAAKGAKAAVIKFRDEAGNTWSGRGKRPNWFKAALEVGKSAEQLAVKA